jgi:endonuclease/exonuclease/phosphatase family metal-dependent hydrolase
MRALFLLIFLAMGTLVHAGDPLTVMTWNIRYMNGHDRKDRWELRREAMVTELRAQHPHILGLQEVLREQLAYLKEQLPGYAHFGVGRDDGAESGEFAPVLWDTTHFTLLTGRTVWLSPTPDVPSMGWDATCRRIVTLVELREAGTGDTVWVANTHWDHEGRVAREHSARMITELLAPLAGPRSAVLFLGDLNATPRETPVQHLTTLLEDACPKGKRGRGTFNGFKRLRMFARRIDYIWMTPAHWHVEHYAVPRPKVKGRQVSDHFPVIVRLRRA